MPDDITLYFILPLGVHDETNTTKDMQEAFEITRQNCTNIEWLAESECLNRDFKKNDIIVFQIFEGEAYNTLINMKCLVIGPWCLMTSFSENIVIPNNASPIWNLSMVNLIITGTNISPEKKKLLKKKIELMGGIYILNVTNKVTHVISNGVTSAKYVVAQELGVPVMLESWVDAVWELSQTKRVIATEDEFKMHACPPFHNLTVSASGLDSSERELVKKLMKDNGGFFTGKLKCTQVNLLICKQGHNSQKFVAARQNNLPCVTLKWVLDSVEKGYALPEDNYKVFANISSTPSKMDAPNPNFSIMSGISTIEHQNKRNEVSETINMTNMSDFNLTLTNKVSSNAGSKPSSDKSDLIDSIDFKQVKLAGSFLDGCNVYLSGFSGEKRDKICRILKSGGATRYDDISDRITHVIVGDSNAQELKLFASRECYPVMLTIQWLIESIKQKQQAPEEGFHVTLKQFSESPSSPLSKKALNMLQNKSLVSEVEAPKNNLSFTYQEEVSLLQQYMSTEKTEEDTLAKLLVQGNINSKLSSYNRTVVDKMTPKKLEDDNTEEQTMNLEMTIFTDKTFILIGFEDDMIETLTDIIDELGGKLQSSKFKGVTDYTVVPTLCQKINHASIEVVNELWLIECHELNEIQPLKYYHYPIYCFSNSMPLKNCVICLTGFGKQERSYLITLVQHLGGQCEEMFAKVSIPKKNVLGATHLICNDPTGNKYNAALRWNVPVVSRFWVTHALEKDKKLNENLYILDVDYTNEVTNKNVSSVTEDVLNESSKHKRTSFLRDTTDISDNEPHLKKQKLENIGQAMTEVVSKDQKEIVTKAALITLEDGREVTVKEYMDDLRKNGLFNPPSPAPNYESPSIIDKKYQDIINSCQILDKGTPTKLQDNLATCSQGTPVGNYIKHLQLRKILPSGESSPRNTVLNQNPSTSIDSTPDTPISHFMGQTPSPKTRKHLQRYLKKIPTYDKRNSTSLSEVKKEIFARFLSPNTIDSIDKKYSTKLKFDNEEEENDNFSLNFNEDESETKKSAVENETKPESEETDSQKAKNIQVENQLQQLQDMMKRRESIGSSRISLLNAASNSSTPQSSRSHTKSVSRFVEKESQNDTVGWEDPVESIANENMQSKVYNFMITGIDPKEKNKLSEIIKNLGGEILDVAYYDRTATHLICQNPSRNEKTLTCLAAGKWILHFSYILECENKGSFIDEEPYEFGNPMCTFKTDQNYDYVFWWRKKIEEDKLCAFHNMRALVFAKTNKSAMTRLIEAGDGVVLNIKPPFTHNIEATHCFIEANSDFKLSIFIPLAQQGILCLNLPFLAVFLQSKGLPNLKNFIPDQLSLYYNN